MIGRPLTIKLKSSLSNGPTHVTNPLTKALHPSAEGRANIRIPGADPGTNFMNVVLEMAKDHHGLEPDADGSSVVGCCTVLSATLWKEKQVAQKKMLPQK